MTVVAFTHRPTHVQYIALVANYWFLMDGSKLLVVRKYTFWGIAFGCFFPLMAVALQINADGLPWRVASVATVHSKHITLWVVNLAPLVLGLFGYWIGTIYARQQTGHTEQLNREIDNNKLILEGCLDGVVTFTAGGKILFRNAAFTALYPDGYQPADFLSVTIFEPMINNHANGQEAGHYMLEGFEGLYRMVTRGTTAFKMNVKPGASVLVSLSMSKTRIKGNSLYTAFIRDVSEQCELEVERDRLFDQTNDLVCIATPDGYFKRINRAFSTTLGFSDEELTAHKYLHFVHPDDRVKSVTDAEYIMNNPGKVVYTENRYITNGGGFVWLAWNTIWDPPTKKIFGIARDITDKLEAERQQAKSLHELKMVNKELDQFAYVVSHDLKAPLRAINSLAGWIAEDVKEVANAEVNENLKLLENRTHRMNNLIDGILAYSRAGKRKGPRALVDVGQLVGEVLDNIGVPNHIEVAVRGELPRLMADKTVLTQVLMNLVSNAVKYHDKPQGHVWIEAKAVGDAFEFVVGDDGPGIEPAYHDRIFEVFQTLEARDVKESTGIGLSIVKKLVEEHQGSIRVESALGQGSAFIFTLPANT